MSSTATTPITEILNYFGGVWQKSSATEFIDVMNPATGDVIARTPLSSKADVDTVVQGAAAAFP
ncbi:MAG TPA: aldehyde dehydrogenase family protein, partial [Candidatus Acidoferrales bacterium]|nr:aldehyde dehydrogenase family protein [Candidatus Acidoferrales bacterium]